MLQSSDHISARSLTSLIQSDPHLCDNNVRNHSTNEPKIMSALRLRAAHKLSQQLRVSHRSITSTPRQLDSSAVTTPKADSVPETTDATGQPTMAMQAPNRTGIWARGQQPRSKAMIGPRFEQTDFSLQVRQTAPGKKPLIRILLMLPRT